MNIRSMIFKIVSLEYIEIKLSDDKEFLPFITLIMEDGGRNLFVSLLTQREFVTTTKNYYWDGTRACAERLHKKLARKFFSFANGIE